MRATATVLFFAALSVFGGCTSSGAEEDGCYRDIDCASGYVCDDSTGYCVAPSDGGDDTCHAPTDCSASYTCGENSRCMPGDCYFNGCVTGFDCQSSTGTWECLPSSEGAAGSSGASGNEDPQAGAPPA